MHYELKTNGLSVNLSVKPNITPSHNFEALNDHFSSLPLPPSLSLSFVFKGYVTFKYWIFKGIQNGFVFVQFLDGINDHPHLVQVQLEGEYSAFIARVISLEVI